MKAFLRIVAVALLFLIASVAVNSWRTRSLLRKAQTIHLGDPKHQVRAILGKPVCVFSPGLFNRTERWAYGDRYFLCRPSAEFPFVLSAKLRWFGPDDQDVVVAFDRSGRVVKVRIPERE